MNINLKKLGAVVVGAVLAASAVATAGLYYENTELVNANGQPVAKVVVGENAAISDAIAASKIATAIASNAYKDVTLSADVVGQATCTATGDNVTATCEVTDKTVTLSVKVPGMEKGEYQFGMLIAEDMDKDLLDRDTENDAYDVNDDAWDEEANPAQNQIGNALSDIGGTEYYAVRVGYDNFNPFAEYNVKSSKFGIDETERQFVYLSGKTKYDDSEHDVVVDPDTVLYQAVFGPDDNGLNLCPGEDTTTAYNDCSNVSKIGASRTKIRFLGSDWVITDLSVAASSSFTDDKEIKIINDATIKLAKEAQFGKLNIGDCLETDQVKICLDDISKNDRQDNPAILSYYDADGNKLDSVLVRPGKSATLTEAGDVRVHVYETAPGYTLGAKWADIAILSDEIELKSGKDFLKDQGNYNSDYKVYLGFTNKLADSDSNAVTNLKEIFLKRDSITDDMLQGDSLELADVEGYKNYELTYNGLTEPDMDSLRLNYETLTQDFTLADGSTQVSFVNTPVVLIRSDEDKAFKTENDAADIGNGTTTTQRGSEMYYIINGSTVSASITVDTGDILFKSDDGDYYIIDTDNTRAQVIYYEYAGHNYGALVFEGDNDGSDPNGNIDNALEFYLTEEIGDVESSPYYGILGFAVNTSSKDIISFGGQDDKVTYGYNDEPDSLRFSTVAGDINGSSADLSTYGYPAGDDYDTTFITLRGTEVQGSGSSRTIKVPKEVRKAQLVFRSTAQSQEEAEYMDYGPLHEGDEVDVGNGVSIKVKSIDVDTTASVSGGASGSAVADMSGVSAVIKEEGSTETYETYNAAKPFNEVRDLVVLDNQAPDTGTVITVGGPVVNTVTAAALDEAGEQLTADNPVIVKAVGDKIVVAGWTADDTLQAAQQFIDALKRQ